MSAGLYIHIPFCKSKCPYCDFYSLRYDENTAEIYADAVIDEIKTGRRAREFTQDFSFEFDTVYFGGGTPSALGGERLARMLSAARQNYKISPESEITAECNPSSSDEKLFCTLADSGFNRISLGMQSAADNERRALGRTADSTKVRQAVTDAKRAGIDSISLDLMIGIPNQSMESLIDSAKFCLELGVKHISAYMLKIEPGTVFDKMGGRLILPDEDAVCDMYLGLIRFLEENGMRQYEISNFAQPGFESRHNLKYWRLDEYLGIGPAAHSFIKDKRFYYERDCEGFVGGGRAVFESDGGDENEFIMLRLRLSDGLKDEDYLARYGVHLPEKILDTAAKLATKGLVICGDGGIRLTKNGFLLSNYVISQLIY